MRKISQNFFPPRCAGGQLPEVRVYTQGFRICRTKQSHGSRVNNDSSPLADEPPVLYRVHKNDHSVSNELYVETHSIANFTGSRGRETAVWNVRWPILWPRRTDKRPLHPESGDISSVWGYENGLSTSGTKMDSNDVVKLYYINTSTELTLNRKQYCHQ